MFSIEILISIFDYLKPHDILKVQQVCKLWNRIGNLEILWKKYSDQTNPKRHFQIEYHWKWEKYLIMEEYIENVEYCSSFGDCIAFGFGSTVTIIKASQKIKLSLRSICYIKLIQEYLLIAYEDESIDLYTLDLPKPQLVGTLSNVGLVQLAEFHDNCLLILDASQKATLYNQTNLEKLLVFYCEQDFTPIAIYFDHTLSFIFANELMHGYEPVVQRIHFNAQTKRLDSSECITRSRQIDHSTNSLVSTDYFDPFTRRWETEPSSYAPATQILYMNHQGTPILIFGHKDGSIHLHKILNDEIIQYQVEYAHFSKITAMGKYGTRVVTCSRDTIIVWSLTDRLSILYHLKHKAGDCPIWCNVTETSIVLLMKSLNKSKLVTFAFA